MYEISLSLSAPTLQRYRKVEPATEVEEVDGVRVLSGDLLDLTASLQHLLDEVR
jgi:hypothetical protein